MILSRSLPPARQAVWGRRSRPSPPFRIGVGVDGSPSGGDAVVLAMLRRELCCCWVGCATRHLALVVGR